MRQAIRVPDGYYRLVKLKEDHNPIFPARETVVEIRGDEITNLSTRRSCKLAMLDDARSLYGPLKSPFDVTPIEKLPSIRLSPAPPEPDTGTFDGD